MLQKLISVSNVGRLNQLKSSGDVAFRRLTLVYAENGCGKSTLCEIIRSAACGDTTPLKGRATLGADGPPGASILAAAAPPILLSGGAWSAQLGPCSVFDGRFVTENIYTGESLTHEHRKNLYNVIVGEQGVTLAKRVKDLDEAIRISTRDISDGVQKLAPATEGLPVDVFRKLPLVPDIEKLIADQERLLAAAQAAQQLATKPQLRSLPSLALPADYRKTLATTVLGMSEAAVGRVNAHMKGHMASPDTGWLQRGVALAQGDSCPFCEQSLKNNELVASFGAYFSKEYAALMSAIDRLVAAAQAVVAPVESVLAGTINENQALYDVWSTFATLPAAPSLDIDKLKTVLEDVRARFAGLTQAKAQHPLDTGDATDIDALEADVRGVNESIDVYNAAVRNTNAAIQERQREAKATDAVAAQKRLSELRATKARHRPDIAAQCTALDDLERRKRNEEKDKKSAKDDLDTYTEAVFPKYQDEMNRLLDRFGATFRLVKTGRSYAGGSPSTQYALEINRTAVDPGDASTPLDKPSFKNTLSAGDRSTLALAFFLTTLSQSPDLDTRIVILDDPFTSLDRSRRMYTQLELRRLVDRARQVIVLSHDPLFLHELGDHGPAGSVKTLQMTRMGDATVLAEWDSAAAISGEWLGDRTKLHRFVHDGEGDERDVARAVRPLLEGYLNMKLPHHFKGSWLGDFISEIRAAETGTPLAAAQAILLELSDCNDYSKRYHHNTNPLADREPIDRVELRTFGRRALDVVGGF